MTTAPRTINLGRRSIPVVLPNPRDARLQTAAVIISIHIIGIVALGFRVSVPQILSAIATAAIIDVILTFRNTGKLVWPASGMLTGSGVALILRLVGMRSGDYWSWTGWYWFSLVAGVSLLSKYVIKYRGTHIFNPSNIGLVAAFLVIGSAVVEPLDFWWAPLGFPMLLAYAIILVGGILITRRLHLLEMAVAYWIVLAIGLGVLAASGHCMIATWSSTPVCNERFWAALVTSPEILIFLFFMITDPKTVPVGRPARVVFAATLGVMTTLLIAPQTVEYGAKVGLLASLALWSPLRGLFDRWFDSVGEATSGTGHLIERINRARPAVVFARGLAIGSTVVVLGAGILVAGAPSRLGDVALATQGLELPISVDVADFPDLEVDDSVSQLALVVDDAFLSELTVNFAEDLGLEAEAIRTGDGSLLAYADAGVRLTEMRASLDEALATGVRWVNEYHFDSLKLSAHEAEGQVSAGLLFSGVGIVQQIIYDPDGEELSRTEGDFDGEFVLRQIGGERWLIVSANESAE
jgi:hypothetical protein